MVIREYNCTVHGYFTVKRSIKDATTEHCSVCGDKADRIYSKPPAISFGGKSNAVKGSGFYTTDYKKSDLLAGRAIEHFEKRFGESPTPSGSKATKLPGE